VFVVDASSLLVVSDLCSGNQARASSVFDEMYRLARLGQLGFPSCVPAVCSSFDTANFAASWAAPVHDGLRIRSVDHSLQTDVLLACNDLSDAGTDDDEEVQVELMAYALFFSNRGDQVTLVTEEIAPLPFRKSIAQAAGDMGMSVLTMQQFMLLRGL